MYAIFPLRTFKNSYTRNNSCKNNVTIIIIAEQKTEINLSNDLASFVEGLVVFTQYLFPYVVNIECQ